MKIGIVGLRPRQVSDIEARNFDLQIEFLTVKDADPLKVERFSRDKDTVVIMTGHVMRDATSMVPSEKRQFINGAVSALSRFLEEQVEALKANGYQGKPVEPWYSDIAYQPGGEVVNEQDWGPVGSAEASKTVVKVDLVEQTVGSGAPVVEKKEAPVEIASQLPEGHRSQYLLPKSDILINYPNSGGVQNYQILLATIPGDVVRFARPEGLSLASWRKRIEMTRHNYWKKHGLLLEAHFFNEYVDVQVMRIEEDVVPKNTLNLTVRDTSEDNPSRDMGKTEVVAVASEGVPATQEPAPRVVKPTLMDVAGGDVLKTLAVSGTLPKAASVPPPLPETIVIGRRTRLRVLLDREAGGDVATLAAISGRSYSQVNKWLKGSEMSTFHARSLEDRFGLPRDWMNASLPLGPRFEIDLTAEESKEKVEKNEAVSGAYVNIARRDNLKLVIENVFFGDVTKFAEEIGEHATDVAMWLINHSMTDEHARKIERIYGLEEKEFDTPLEQPEAPKPVWPIMRGNKLAPVAPTPVAEAPQESEEDHHEDAALIERLGGVVALAERLGFEVEGGAQRVWNWKMRGIPAYIRLQHPDVFGEGEVAEEEVATVPEVKLKAPKEAKLWRDVLVTAVRYGQEVDVAIDDADEALEAYRARFGV